MCPSLEAKAIRKYIAVEDTTEMGHMKHIQKGVKSTTTKSRCGRPSKLMQPTELTEAMEDATSTQTQEPNNKKTHLVFMLVQKAERYIESNKTGMFPRTSNRGMKCICVFYICDHNFIKGIPLKSRKKDDLFIAYKEIYAY